MPGPSSVTLSATWAAPGSGSASVTVTVVLSVTDDGPGIPADLQPGLFERFVRGDSSRSHAAGSTGLGLAIVDAVTAAHGGSVGVTSRPGRTSFVITLPGMEGPLSARAGQPPGIRTEPEPGTRPGSQRPGTPTDETAIRHT